MINQTNRELLIQQYIEGSLSEQDTKKFETLLKRDTTLRNDVALQREINANIEEAFDLQDLDGLLNDVVKDNKEFIKQVSKSAFKQKKRSKNFKNLIIVFVLVGAVASGGAWLVSNKKKATANKLANLPEHSVSEKMQLSKGNTEAMMADVKPTQEEDKATTDNMQEQNTPKTETPKAKTLKSALVLPPLRSQLDSLPEFIADRGMGYGKTAGVRTKYRPVYFYNRLPKADAMHTEVYYQFRDTLKVYGQVVQRDQLLLLFKPQQGEYYLVSPKDTIPLVYKERKIRPLKK